MVLTTAPTLYEYYTGGAISSGLSVDQPYFTLNGTNVSIHSGAMHYFRIPKPYWRDRLRKLRAAGLNTVETYVPWNLHEPQDGTYDFGQGGTDFQDFLHVEDFLRTAQEEDLFAIVRPGPYICAEWEGGGVPSWVLAKSGENVRTSDPTYMKFVQRYFSVLLPLLAALQFMNGGPIIGFQVENEYASSPVRDLGYVRDLVGIFRDNGIKELLLSSDGPSYGSDGTVPELLFQTVNFGNDPNGSLDALSGFQPGKPYMVMEYWTGWFDHWSEEHHTVSNDTFRSFYESILAYPASVNMYMFHGGTNWGFLNGANKGGSEDYQPTTTSYGYDAPLSEAGDYTGKYEIVRELLKKYNKIELLTPDSPELVPRDAYNSVIINGTLSFESLLDQAPKIESGEILPMDKLSIKNHSGQSYGYIVYQTVIVDLPKSTNLTMKGYVYDSVIVLVNGELVSNVLASSSDLDGFGYWRTENSLKGLTENVYLNDDVIKDWEIFPFEFKRKWNNDLTGWVSGWNPRSGPALYKGILEIENENPKDTFINMEKWNTGIVIVNGFVLGRYLRTASIPTSVPPKFQVVKMVLTTAPTLYEYYTGGGISSGLSVDQPYFTLNGKNVSIHSGAMHYFRIPKPYWRDRLKKLRAAGLNTVETYVPWNLHEPQDGTYDFGQGGTDFQDFLDVEDFLRTAQEEDLFAIVRPGPFICAEWEGGGVPSWVLAKSGENVRTSDPTYMKFVRRYFSVLLPLLAALQFMNGGPIIGFQVENEYGANPVIDLDYLRDLVGIFRDNGIKELLLTSDGASYGLTGTVSELLLQAVNFGSDPNGSLNALSGFQPGKPYMVMEYWTGWFDHWSEEHHTVSNDTFRSIYESILEYPASVNLYMFHGGTNWGFLNGANKGGPRDYQPVTTSYDYDAPLSEAGDYTGKYEIVRELLQKYNEIELLTPDPPELVPREGYSLVIINGTLSFEGLLDQAPKIESDKMLPMDKLPINNDSGQSYGYIVYQTVAVDLLKSTTLTIKGYVYDSVIVLVNGELVSKVLESSSDLDGFGYWRTENSSIVLTADEDLRNATIQLIVENWGRINVGHIGQSLKGLTENVYLNDDVISHWEIFPLEFKRKWNNDLTGWVPGWNPRNGPALYKGILEIENENPKDTFINMEKWNTGIVIVNGFVLGRYSFIGPQQTLYLPGPFLKTGQNEIIIFEHFSSIENINFTTDPIFANH